MARRTSFPWVVRDEAALMDPEQNAGRGGLLQDRRLGIQHDDDRMKTAANASRAANRSEPVEPPRTNPTQNLHKPANDPCKPKPIQTNSRVNGLGSKTGLTC